MKTYAIPVLALDRYLNHPEYDVSTQDFLKLELNDTDAADGKVKVSSSPSGLSFDISLGAFLA
jgi:hypothetical protein